ncbi:hydrolase [Bacillus cereus]|nr:hydrolase [Bacillus cereus]
MSLQKKIDALGLAPIDSKVYNEYLKHMESIGVGVRHFKHYKLYGQTFMPYSQEYLLGNSIECLLKRDKENYKRLCPLFFGRLKRRIDRWGRR